MNTREEAAAAMLRGVPDNFDPFGPDFFDPNGMGADDPHARAGLTTLRATLTIADGAALNLDLFSEGHLDSVGLPTGLVSIGLGTTLTNYKSVLRYFASNPSQIRSLLITSSEANNNAPLLSSMVITPTRNMPFGSRQSNSRYVQDVQTTADFQANRVTFPMTLALDTFTFINFATDTNDSGDDVSIKLSFMIGRRAEIRQQIGAASPLTVRPGGRGVAKAG